MRAFPVRPLSRALEVAVYFFLLCNIAVLVLLPFLLAKNYSVPDYTVSLLGWPSNVSYDRWSEYVQSLCVFYISGLASFLLLWQGRTVLHNLAEGKPFLMQNALCLRRAAFCCFVISAAALIRPVITALKWESLRVILYGYSYSLLFIPLFLLAGLFCLLLAELFRQAAVLREDNSLVI